MTRFCKTLMTATGLLSLLLAGPGLPAQSAATPAKPKTTTTTKSTKRKTVAKSGAVKVNPGEKLEEVAVLETEAGTIVVRFFPEVAPGHVASFKNLVKTGFYTGTRFHRIIEGFMIQGGDPNSKDLAKKGSWGTGGVMGADGKEVMLKAEFNKVHHGRGVLSMARSNDPNSASSQFFVMHGDAPFLDNQYTAFGEVVSGIEVVDKIVTGPKAGDQATQPVMIKKGWLEMRSVPPSPALAAAGITPAK